MMIKSKFVLDDVGVQLETQDEGLYVSFCLDAEYGVKPICKVLLSDLVSEYIGSNHKKEGQATEYAEGVMLFNAEQLMYEFDFIASELQDIINKASSEKKCNSNIESMDDVFPDSGFGDDF